STLPYSDEAETLDPNRPKVLRVYGMSDIHLNNHYHPLKSHSNPYQHRPKVIQFLDEILEVQALEESEVVLILNGDIIDITGSWPHDVSPLRITAEKRLETVRQVIGEILDSNPEVVRRLRKFLECENTRLVYIIGNHDRWMNHDSVE